MYADAFLSLANSTNGSGKVRHLLPVVGGSEEDVRFFRLIQEGAKRCHGRFLIGTTHTRGSADARENVNTFS